MDRAQSSRQPLRVLLVEDNSIDAEVVLRRAAQADDRPLAVERADSLAAALAATAAASYDVIVLDLGLPDSAADIAPSVTIPPRDCTGGSIFCAQLMQVQPLVHASYFVANGARMIPTPCPGDLFSRMRL